jgi:PIN like domain
MGIFSMSDQQKPSKDESNQKEASIERVFLANDVLPDAAVALVDRIDSIEDAIKTADIVLDTNVLLLPYGAGASSLKEIITVFKGLKEKGRLFLPAQVAREFVKNRPNKLSELQQGIADKIGRYVGILVSYSPSGRRLHIDK